VIRRFARLKINGQFGDWIESCFGTSAGMILGPLLFIMYLHDTPKSIYPIFADDLTAISVAKSYTEVEMELQQAVDDLMTRAQRWAMDLNVTKTKVGTRTKTTTLIASQSRC